MKCRRCIAMHDMDCHEQKGMHANVWVAQQPGGAEPTGAVNEWWVSRSSLASTRARSAAIILLPLPQLRPQRFQVLANPGSIGPQVTLAHTGGGANIHHNNHLLPCRCRLPVCCCRRRCRREGTHPHRHIILEPHQRRDCQQLQRASGSVRPHHAGVGQRGSCRQAETGGGRGVQPAKIGLAHAGSHGIAYDKPATAYHCHRPTQPTATHLRA